MNVKGTRTKVYGGLTVLSPTYICQCAQLRNPPMNVKGIQTKLSSLYAARHFIGLSTTQMHSKAMSLVTDLFVLLSHWFLPQKASHSLQYSLLRDKARLPKLSNFLHSWLQVHRLLAQLCCSGGSN